MDGNERIQKNWDIWGSKNEGQQWLFCEHLLRKSTPFTYHFKCIHRQPRDEYAVENTTDLIRKKN